MRGIAFLVISMSFVACDFSVLSTEDREEIRNLTETVEEISGDFEEQVEGVRSEISDVCEITDRRISEIQQTLGAACEGIADAEKKRKCQDFNRRSTEVIERIRRRCQEEE